MRIDQNQTKIYDFRGFKISGLGAITKIKGYELVHFLEILETFINKPRYFSPSMGRYLSTAGKRVNC